jgi:hypothetical protein
LDYSLETDLRGDVKAGTKQQITIHPRSSDSGTLPGRVTAVTLEISFDDGATWEKVNLVKGAGSFKAAPKPGGFISVRATATMSSGYGVSQEIIRAYGLR